MTTAQFSLILSSCKNSFKVQFSHCKLEIEEVPDLGEIEECQLREVSFRSSGKQELSDWKEKIERFENVVEGLGKIEGMTKNLDCIGMEECELSDEKITEVLSGKGFETTRIAF